MLAAPSSLYLVLLRVALIMLLTGHHVVLFVLSLRCLEGAYQAVLSTPSVASASIAAGLLLLATLFAIRFGRSLAALLTPEHDAADKAVAGTKLDPQRHVPLFQAVTEVARRIGAPVPHEIWISDDASCFAFEQRRFRLSTHRILVLVLGLPHLLILRSDELAVIVGHELTHFRQQDTTLAVFFYRFSQSLRLALDAAAKHRWRWLNPALWIEWGSYQFFCLLIAPFQRGQEIAADCRTAELHGGDVARRTLLREWFIANRFEALVQQRFHQLERGQDNDRRTIYEQFVEEWRDVSMEGQQFLREKLEELEQESYWDSHPALKHRLAAVSAYPNIGTDPSAPATELIGSLPELLERLGLRRPHD